MRYFGLIALAVGALAAAQPNPRDLVRQSIKNGELAWERSFYYACTKRDVDRQIDSSGGTKSVDDDVYQVIPLAPISFQKLVTHDGRPPESDERQKEQRQLRQLESETPAQRAARLAKLKRERSYMAEVPDAFDFRIVGTENLPTGPAWVLEATPHPGYVAKSRYAHMFPYMRGKLWIDKKDVQWVKADAVATSTVTFGFFIARLSKGSHIIIEQTKLPDGSWVPSRITARADARTFLIFNHNFEENITYSNYHLPPTASASAAHPQ